MKNKVIYINIYIYLYTNTYTVNKQHKFSDSFKVVPLYKG